MTALRIIAQFASRFRNRSRTTRARNVRATNLILRALSSRVLAITETDLGLELSCAISRPDRHIIGRRVGREQPEIYRKNSRT